jgi:hypothetical protein
MSDWSTNGLGRLLGWQAAPAAAPAAQAPAAAPLASVDLAALGVGPIGHGSPAEQVFGCRCSTNPSGLSPAEIAAAQAENMQASAPGGSRPSFLS